jgi:hypothetical protein
VTKETYLGELEDTLNSAMLYVKLCMRWLFTLKILCESSLFQCRL